MTDSSNRMTRTMLPVAMCYTLPIHRMQMPNADGPAENVAQYRVTMVQAYRSHSHSGHMASAYCIYTLNMRREP